jgi:ubiquinone/menaquinone biosynthesis C-methylase UbiE
MASVHDSVQEYYGKILKTSEDLKTNACTTGAKPPKHIAAAISLIHEEVEAKYYGCGLIIPTVLKGMRILDLGSGSGRDCFILSKLVGENGYIVGVDMTTEQINTARNYIDYHTKKFGYSKPNVEFRQGYIEALDTLGFEDNSFDIIVSNCVINLSPDKEAVLKQAFRVLKDGGELYFSDVYSDRRIPTHLVKDSVLYGECLSGALYWNDFISLAKKVGFQDPRLVEDSIISVTTKKYEELVGHIRFFSATYRLFKIDGLEPSCEDYGQAVIYKGGISDSVNTFTLDKGHVFPAGKVVPVCGNTFDMLSSSRFKPYFEFIGDKGTHFGIFSSCGEGIPFDLQPKQINSSKGGCCS